jgi:hypothetical protein
VDAHGEVEEKGPEEERSFEWETTFTLIYDRRLSTMAGVNFRKIDIDAYDEDAFQ